MAEFNPGGPSAATASCGEDDGASSSAARADSGMDGDEDFRDTVTNDSLQSIVFKTTIGVLAEEVDGFLEKALSNDDASSPAANSSATTASTPAAGNAAQSGDWTPVTPWKSSFSEPSPGGDGTDVADAVPVRPDPIVEGRRRGEPQQDSGMAGAVNAALASIAGSSLVKLLVKVVRGVLKEHGQELKDAANQLANFSFEKLKLAIKVLWGKMFSGHFSWGYLLALLGFIVILVKVRDGSMAEVWQLIQVVVKQARDFIAECWRSAFNKLGRWVRKLAYK